jgi:hypothetical protein
MPSVIASAASDLAERLSAVPALSGRVGMSLGGRGSDPAMTKVPLPAAWLVLAKHTPVDPDTHPVHTPKSQMVAVGFTVLLFFPYAAQEELVSTWYPLLEDIIRAVRGEQTPSGTTWRYGGSSLKVVAPDRLGYEVAFTAHVVI